MFHYGLSYEQTTIGLTTLSPQRYIDYINTFGSTNRNLLGNIGWSRDTRDSAIFTTEGTVQRSFLEMSLPSSDQRYVKWTYQHQLYYPINRSLTLLMNGDIGVAGGYGGNSLPFFKNFYAGGPGSVRGFKAFSLGPQDAEANVLGGTRKISGGAEVLFPMPGAQADKSLRLTAFIDAGQVYGVSEKVKLGELRYSAGIGLAWSSPFGPLKISLAQPLNQKKGFDRVERLQLNFGTAF